MSVRLVVQQCQECSKNVATPENWKEYVFCDKNCKSAYIQKAKAKISDAETDKFLAANESYYDCPYNNKLIVDLLAAWKLDPTAANLDATYVHLLAERKLLGKLTMRDVNAMDAPTYDARLKIDPAMGGVLEEIETTGTPKFDAPVSYKTGGTGGWEKMAKANLQDRQRQADDRAIARRRS
jgi:hypothetical protein